MSDEILRKQAAIIPPRPGLTFARAASTTPASLDVSAYAGRYITIVADGANLYVLLGTQAQAEAVDNTAVSGDTQAQMIPQNGSADFLLANEDNFLGFETASGTGTIRVHVSSGRTGTD